MVVFYLYFLAVYLGVEVAVPHQEDNPHHHTTTAPPPRGAYPQRHYGGVKRKQQGGFLLDAQGYNEPLQGKRNPKKTKNG